MVDSQRHPDQDGLDHLFGDSAFDMLIGGKPAAHHSVSVPIAGTPQYTSRRDARAAAPNRRGSKAAGKQAKGKQARPSRRQARASARSTRPTPPPAFVKPFDSAYPVERVIVVRRAAPVKTKRRGSGFLTILAVVGLFGSVALPAYAMNPLVTADASLKTETKSDDIELSVNADAATTETVRGEFRATSGDDLRTQRRTAAIAANFAAYMASGARELGDDYPWFSELSNNQGGGSSPLRYFYRECVDFVAWRLNRDAGSTSAPFLYTWSELTPTGGNAYQWKYAWIKHGWPTSTTPIAGAVAWYSYGHVAYVKSVNADGTITVEDYNQSGMHVYGQRVVAPNDATLYLYPPPR